MQQVHLLFYGSGVNIPAKKNTLKNQSITRDIIECQLIEEYHWLPQDIEKISYKKIQTLLAYKKQKAQFTQTQANVNKAKSQQQGSRGSGQFKRTYREV